MQTSDNFLINVINGFSSRVRKFFYNPYKKANISRIYLKYLKHVPAGKLHYHKLFGNKTWFYDGQEYLHGIKEIFIQEIYKQVLPVNAFILDCGANIGLSVIYLKKICPSATIIAFEPDTHNFKLLEKNIQSHELRNVELKNLAIWKEDTMISFDSEGSMASKINFNKKENQSEMIQAVRLKNYLNRKIDFLKIDIEGAEFEVIKDIEDVMDNIETVFIEYHGNFEQNNELTELFRILKTKGFFFYIKEASDIYKHPFIHDKKDHQYNLQLNIFCFRK
jgi:FkbM family methyltransferase